MFSSRWEILGDMLVTASLALYSVTLVLRVVAGDLTTAESSVITQVLVVVGMTLGFGFQQYGLWQARREQSEQRLQDKADEEQRAKELAELTVARAKILELQSQQSHQETLKRISEVHEATTQALDVSNHANDKIATLTDRLDNSLQIGPIVTAAVAQALQPSQAGSLVIVQPALDRTPGTILTEAPAPDAPSAPSP